MATAGGLPDFQHHTYPYRLNPHLLTWKESNLPPAKSSKKLSSHSCHEISAGQRQGTWWPGMQRPRWSRRCQCLLPWGQPQFSVGMQTSTLSALPTFCGLRSWCSRRCSQLQHVRCNQKTLATFSNPKQPHLIKCWRNGESRADAHELGIHSHLGLEMIANRQLNGRSQ